MRIEVPLRVKQDRNGHKYLFGSLEMFNLVLFIYSEGEGPDGDKRPMLVLRPYRDEGRRGAHRAERDDEDFKEPWKETG